MPANDDFWPLTEQQRQLRHIAREFAHHHIASRAARLDQEARFSPQIYRQMASQGLLGLPAV